MRRKKFTYRLSLLIASFVAVMAIKPPAVRAAAAEHHLHHGRRHRLVQHRRLPPGHHGGPDAESRPARCRGHALHRLLRRGELHGGPRQLHHRRAPDPHRLDDGRPGRLADRHAGAGADHRHRAQVAWATPPASSARTTSATCNEFLPTVHGFDEFFGYLYHLDAMEDPAHPQLSAGRSRTTVGPRNMVHSWATNVDDPTVQPRWGKIGKQKIEDAGTLYPKRMETVDDEILDQPLKFIDKAKADGKPFFLWLNPTRMHVVTHLSEKYEKHAQRRRTAGPCHEAGMAQLDDIVGSVMKKLKDDGLDDNTIVVFTTDNGAENFTWPDGGQTPFAGGKGTCMEGGFRVPCIAALAGQGARRQGRERHHVRARLVPDLRRRRRQPEHRRGAEEGQAARRPHLQGPPRRLQPDGPDHRQGARRSATRSSTSPRARFGAVRIDDYKYRFTDQPSGWLGGTVKVDWPILVNLRLDPFERTGMLNGKDGSLSYYNWFVYQFWRFQFVQQEVAKVAQTAIEFPPMQKGASFNLEAVKEQIEKAIQSRAGK